MFDIENGRNECGLSAFVCMVKIMDKVVFAVDIGGSKLLCGFVTAQGDIIDTEKIPLSHGLNVDGLEKSIAHCYVALCKRNPTIQPAACGMTIPGVADPKTGMWVYACFSGIADYPVVSRMQTRLGMSVTIENDANANAWGERVFGNCRDCDNFMWVTVSNGVGGGLVLNGKLYQGFAQGAGEIGHLIVARDGLLCPCGHRGCMEAMTAGPAISKRYELRTGKKCSAAEIAALCRTGHADATAIIKETAEYIGRGLGKTASLLNLQKYVLGGGVMQSFDLMRNDIELAFREEAFTRPNQTVSIVQTALGYEAGLLGAAALAVCPPDGM